MNEVQPEKQQTLTERRQLRVYAVCLAVLAALCVLMVVPVLMAWAWIHYFAVYLQVLPDPWNLCLALSGVAAAYSLDRVMDLDPRLREASYGPLPFILRVVFVLAFMSSIFFLWMSAAVQWPVVCICAVLSVANWFCKRITGAKTLLVTAAWTCACFFLPFPGAQVHPAALGCLCMWMSIFALACVLCDIKDVSFDRLRRIRSLPVAIGVQETRRFVLLLLVLIAAVAGYFAYPELALVCVALLFINQSQRILENMLWSPLCVDGTLLVLAVGYVLYRS